MRSALKLHTLGPVQLLQGNEIVTGFESRKALALLCYLAAQPRPFSREHLIDLFWPDKPEARGRGNLSRVLNNLSGLLPQVVQSDRQQVWFERNAGVWLDVEAFASLAQQPDVLSVGAAVELFRGDFLEDLLLDDCPEFEIWAVAEREYVRQQATQAFNDLIAYYLNQDALTDALALAERLLKLNPWQEEAHRQLMLVLASSGQCSAALKQFERCKAVLEQELQVAPSENTLALYQRIVNQDPLDPMERWMPTARRLLQHGFRLPTPATPLVGRTQELAGLGQQLTDPQCRIISVVGPGGVGKTRLALEVAHQLLEHFAHGVNFVSLEALDDAAFLESELADAFKLSFQPGDDPKARLIDYLRGKQVLLVVDGFERLVERAGVLAELVSQTQTLKLLVTSRQRLQLKEEQVFVLNGFSVPDDAADPAQRPAASVLFEQSAQRSDPGFALSEHNQEDIFRIGRLVEGLPLALELAAASIHTLSCQQIAEEIERNLDVLSHPQRDVAPQHHSMRATFEYTWKMLNTTEKRLLVQLATFRGGFMREAFEAVTGKNMSALGPLLDKSVVKKEAGQRFGIHALLRQFLLERLEQDPKRSKAARCAHCRYYAGLAKACGARLHTADQLVALDQLSQELENVRAAWQTTLDAGEQEVLGMLVGPLSRFFDLRSRYQEGLALFTSALHALSAAGRDTSLACAKMRVRQGVFYLHQGDFERSQQALEQGVSLLKGHKAAHESAFALNSLGEVFYAKGLDEQALHHLQRSLAQFETLNDEAGMATVYNNLGNLAWRQGDYEKATQLHQRALALRKAQGDAWGTASSLNNLGAVAYHQKDYPSAQTFFQQALGIAHQINHPLEKAACLNNLGEIARQQGDLAQAQKHHLASRKIRKEIGNRIGIAYSDNNLGDVLLAMGQNEEAYAHYRQAARQAMEVEAVPAVIYILSGIARWHVKQKDWEQATQLLGFIQASPHGQDVEDRVQRLLAELEKQVPKKQLNAWVDQGEKTTLEAWVKAA